jgi:dTDP-4-amino-4,6-dideoxygalactose transaminase
MRELPSRPTFPSPPTSSIGPFGGRGTLGDGGAVTTNDGSIANRLRKLRKRQKDWSKCLGWDSRLNSIQAAILRVELNCLDEGNACRRRIAAKHRQDLSGLEWVRLPCKEPWAGPAHHLFVIRARERRALAGHPSTNLISTAIHYRTAIPPIATFPCRYRSETLRPYTTNFSVCTIGPHMSDAQVDHVVDAINGLAGRAESTRP